MSGSYIVVFKDHATPEQIQSYVDDLNSSGGKVTHRYGAVLKGFAAKIPPDHFASLNANLGADSPIDYIESDSVVTTQ